MEMRQYHARRAKRRLKKGALVLIAALLFIAVVVLLIIVSVGGAEATALYGPAVCAEKNSAVVVRNEKLVTTGDYDLAEFYAAEGQRVEPGDHIMDVYKMGFSREITSSLWNTKQEIYEEQLNVLGEARDVELRNYDDRIDSAKQRLAHAVLSGDQATVPGIQKELTDLLSARSEYLRGYIQPSEKLRGLYQKEEDWQHAVDDGRISLNAEVGGVVSYYFDDYSQPLNADKLTNATSDLISKAYKRSNPSKMTASTNAKSNAFRIVDTDDWYLVFLSSADQPLRVTEDMYYTVEIEGYGSFEGVGVSSTVNDKKAINVIHIEQDMGALINVRAVKATVTYSASGIKIDRKAIQFSDLEPFIEVITPEGKVGVYVNVLADDGKYAIVTAKNTDNAPVEQGMKYWIP